MKRFEDHRMTFDRPTGWLLSYVDVMTLLIALFVLLLALSRADEGQFRRLIDSLSLAPAPGGAGIVPEPTTSSTTPAADTASDLPPDPAIARLRAEIRDAGLAGKVLISRRARRAELVIDDKVLFASGIAELSAEGRSLLARLAPLVASGGGGVAVEGHTDPLPIATDRYPSNWELSSARASRVVRHLIDLGIDSHRLTAVGHADTRPIDSNDNPNGRARNRRVNIVLETGK